MAGPWYGGGEGGDVDMRILGDICDVNLVYEGEQRGLARIHPLACPLLGWDPSASTLLQVLVSIQSLILVCACVCVCIILP